ncbi:MAG: hypothetical protein ABIO70_00925 [Pseudomonadota bacterium]
MPELDDLIRDLKGAAPLPRAPELPARTPRLTIALAALVLVGAGIWVVSERGPYSRERGGTATPEVDLRMVVERDGRSLRVSRDGPCHVGESVYFRVASSPAGEVVLWVEGPIGKEPIARKPASPVPADLQTPTGMVSYEFERPGAHTFVLAPAGKEDCPAAVCSTLTLEVE